jgi:lipoprotein NlpI
MKRYKSNFQQLAVYFSEAEQMKLKQILKHLRRDTADTICLLWLFELKYLASPYIEENAMRMIYNAVKEEVYSISK